MVGLAPGQLVLECSVEAEPAPQIEWHRDGIVLQVGARQGHPFCASQAPGPDQTGSQALRDCPVPVLCVPALLVFSAPVITVNPILQTGTPRQGQGLRPGLPMHIRVLPIIPSSHT